MKDIVLSSVLVTDPDIEKRLTDEAGFHLTFIPNDDDDAFKEAIKTTDGIITADKKITNEMIQSMENCKVIARQGIGYDTIDIEAAKGNDIIVSNVPDYSINEVSDFTVGLILNLTRHIYQYNKHVHDGVWDVNSIYQINDSPIMRRLNTQIVGILGLGKIGRLVAKKMNVFGPKILAYDPFVKQEEADSYNTTLVDLDELLRKADIIALNLPLNKETYHILDKNAFEMMKDEVFIVNTGRGGLIDEDALCRYLDNGKIGGVALDVLEQEPPDKNDKLMSYENVILTPHAAFLSVDSFEEMRVRACNEVIRVLKGEEPENQVNK